MENNENFVEQTENVEQTTEQTEQPELKYSQADVDRMVKEKLDEVLPGKIARRESRIRKEYDRKYGDLANVLMAGTGETDIGVMTNKFRTYYTEKGRTIPEKPSGASQRDIEVLAQADAAEIIRGGFDEVIEEADRLKELGVENMTPRDKALFVALTNHIKDTETSRALSKLGVTEDVYGSKEFQDFRAMFNPNVPIEQVYEQYRKQLPKKEIKSMGSMKSTVPHDTGLKDFYSFEEASKFTKKDFDNNPALYKRVQESMTEWK